MKSGVVLFGGISVATAGLGVWQMQRYYWKQDLIKKNNELFHSSVENIVEVDNHRLSKKFEDMKGHRISIQGVYDHSKEVLLGPRSAPGLTSKKAQGMTTNPMGYFVITPLYLSNGSRVFVNRGWVPLNCSEWSRPQGLQTTVAIVQEWEQKSTFTPANDLQKGRFLWLDGKAFLQVANSKSPDLSTSSTSQNDEEIPLIIERLDNSSEPETPLKDSEKYPLSRDMNYIDQNYVTPEVHFAYSVTWFSLAIAAAVVAGYARKSKRKMKIFK